MSRVIFRAIISLVIFLGIGFIVSFYNYSLSIKYICYTIGLPYFIITLLIFPYNREKKHQIIYLAISPGLFWAFHLTTIFIVGNLYQLFPNLILLSIIVGFLFIEKTKKVYFPVIIFSFVLTGTLLTINQLLKVDIKDMIISKEFQFEQNIGDKDVKIIEFWYSSCSSCISNFDKFQEFYDAKKNDYDILSINIRIRRDTETNFKPVSFVKARGFNFPVLEMENKVAEQQFGITSTPSLMVVKDDRIIFHENMIVSASLLEEILEKVD